MDNKIDKYQFELMAHTMSDRGRNWFATDDQTKPCCALNDLVDKGYATRSESPSFCGDDWIFSLTEEGIKALEANNGKRI